MEAEGIFVVASELGLHARPAGEFVRVTGASEAEVEVSRGSEWVNGQSVLSLLSLAATQGTELRIRVRGPRAAALLAELASIVERPHQD
jgi:phosphocarrier protein